MDTYSLFPLLAGVAHDSVDAHHSYMHNVEVLKLAFDIQRGNCPPYFYDYLNPNNDIIKCTRNHSYLNSISRISSKSFLNKAKQLWLNVPNDIIDVDSRNSFKFRIQKYYLEKQSNENLPIHNEDCCDYSCIDAAILNAVL